MKRALIIAFVFALSNFAMSQIVYDRFYHALEESDSVEMETAINEIRASEDQSAERYIAEYNYYIKKALVYSGVTMSKEYPDEYVDVIGEVLQFSDSTDTEAGYMYAVNQWDEEMANRAVDVINKGIEMYPERLDMHYGKIHLMRMMRWWNAYADAIHATLDYAEKHRKAMVFPDGKDPIDTILIEGILDYERDLLEAIQKSPDSLAFATRVELLRGIAEHMLRIYPKDVYYLNIMAVSYQLVEDRKNALNWLLKAEKVAPKDATVLSNIADTYHLMGDTGKERKYLEKVIKYDDGEYAERAKQYLEELNNNQ